MLVDSYVVEVRHVALGCQIRLSTRHFIFRLYTKRLTTISSYALEIRMNWLREKETTDGTQRLQSSILVYTH